MERRLILRHFFTLGHTRSGLTFNGYSFLPGPTGAIPAAFAPIFEKLAKNYGAEVLFVEINVDESSALAERYAIRPLPTVLLIRGGIVVERLAGGQLNNHLAETLSQYVGPLGLSH